MEIKKNIPNNTVTRKLVDFDHGQIGNVHQILHYFAPFTAR